jgi:hypothetical protein
MRVNEHAGQVQQGKRLSDIDRAFGDERAQPETRAKRLGAQESRRPAARTVVRRPPRYGAGF